MTDSPRSFSRNLISRLDLSQITEAETTFLQTNSNNIHKHTHKLHTYTHHICIHSYIHTYIHTHIHIHTVYPHYGQTNTTHTHTHCTFKNTYKHTTSTCVILFRLHVAIWLHTYSHSCMASCSCLIACMHAATL